MLRKSLIVSALVVLLGLGSAVLHADVLTYNLDFTFSGGPPPGTPPWLTAVIEDESPDQVKMTLTAAGLAPGLGVKTWDFNLTDPSLLFGMTLFQAENTIPILGISPSWGPDIHQADGDGKYDITIDFDTAPANRFQFDDTVVLHFSGTGLTAAAFNALSAPGGGAGQFHTAAHIIGYPDPGTPCVDTPGNCTSGWIADGRPIPEPSSVLLGALACAGVMWAGRKRRHLS